MTTQHYGTLANVQFGYSETLVAIVKQAEAHPDQPIIWFWMSLIVVRRPCKAN